MDHIVIHDIYMAYYFKKYIIRKMYGGFFLFRGYLINFSFQILSESPAFFHMERE